MEKSRYRIEYASSVLKDMSKLSEPVVVRIKQAIEERLTTNPNEYGKPLVGNLKYHRRLRVGDFRVVYRVYEEKVFVLVVAVDHRKQVYEP